MGVPLEEIPTHDGPLVRWHVREPDVEDVLAVLAGAPQPLVEVRLFVRSLRARPLAWGFVSNVRLKQRRAHCVAAIAFDEKRNELVEHGAMGVSLHVIREHDESISSRVARPLAKQPDQPLWPARSVRTGEVSDDRRVHAPRGPAPGELSPHGLQIAISCPGNAQPLGQRWAVEQDRVREPVLCPRGHAPTLTVGSDAARSRSDSHASARRESPGRPSR